MPDWKTLSSEEVYATPWITVRRDEVLNQRGKRLTYSVVDLAHPSVFIVAINEAGKILLQHEYKYTINSAVWSIPAGHSDGQDIIEAAKRELLEETGFTSDDWTDLGRQYQATGIANLPLHVVAAQNVQRLKESLEEDEDILEQRFLSLQEIDHMIAQGEFQDAPAISSIYLARAHKLIKEV